MILRIFCIINLLLLGITTSYADQPFGVEFRYVNVMPGQTLGEIVNRLYPDEQAQHARVIAEIVRLNPHAFERQDPNRMQAGVKLVLPRTADLDNAQRRQVGRVTHSEGRSGAIDLLGRGRALATGAPIYTGDLLETQAGSRLHLLMLDGAYLYLRPCSEFRIVDYHYESGQSGRSRLLLLRGGVATATGRIGREFRRNYALGTPLATIGVRGTEYAVQFCVDQRCEPCADPADAGPRTQLHVGVIDGSVDVNLPRETMAVNRDQYLLASSDDRPPVFADRDPDGLLQAIRAEPTLAPKVDIKQDSDRPNWLWWVLGAALLGLAL